MSDLGKTLSPDRATRTFRAIFAALAWAWVLDKGVILHKICECRCGAPGWRTIRLGAGDPA